MGFVCSIANKKEKVEYIGMMCMLLCYAQNNTGGINRMLNLRTKRIVLSRDVIWINKTYDEDVLIKENTKANTYILQYEYMYDNWYHIKMDPAKT